MGKQCYCGSATDFEDCCQPRLTGEAPAESPEELMRSRFSAFCREDIDYLIETHESKQAPEEQRAALQESMANTRWQSLRVLASSAGNDSGSVEFVAFYQTGGSPGQLHEHSRFVRREKRWLYVDGQILAPIKIGRNDPCRCGSGKKSKKCCNADH